MFTFPAKKLPVCRISYIVSLCSPMDLVLCFSTCCDSSNPDSSFQQYPHVYIRVSSLEASIPAFSMEDVLSMSLPRMHFRVQWIRGYIRRGSKLATGLNELSTLRMSGGILLPFLCSHMLWIGSLLLISTCIQWRVDGWIVIVFSAFNRSVDLRVSVRQHDAMSSKLQTAFS